MRYEEGEQWSCHWFGVMNTHDTLVHRLWYVIYIYRHLYTYIIIYCIYIYIYIPIFFLMQVTNHSLFRTVEIHPDPVETFSVGNFHGGLPWRLSVPSWRVSPRRPWLQQVTGWWGWNGWVSEPNWVWETVSFFSRKTWKWKVAMILGRSHFPLNPWEGR